MIQGNETRAFKKQRSKNRLKENGESKDAFRKDRRDLNMPPKEIGWKGRITPKLVGSRSVSDFANPWNQEGKHLCDRRKVDPAGIKMRWVKRDEKW